jgi:hypothetical protein
MIMMRSAAASLMTPTGLYHPSTMIMIAMMTMMEILTMMIAMMIIATMATMMMMSSAAGSLTSPTALYQPSSMIGYPQGPSTTSGSCTEAICSGCWVGRESTIV